MRHPAFHIYSLGSDDGVIRKRLRCHGGLVTAGNQQWRSRCSEIVVAYRWTAVRSDPLFRESDGSRFRYFFEGTCPTHGTPPEEGLFHRVVLHSPWMPFEDAVNSLLDDLPREMGLLESVMGIMLS